MTAEREPWLPIQTERLRLRRVREADFEDIHAYASDPRVARFMHWGPNSREETRAHLDKVLDERGATAGEEIGLAIEHLEEGRVIGSIALHPFDTANRTMAVGYCLHADFWGHGIALEAARALIDAAITALDLHRIVATCDIENTGSFRVMEKLGMRREACFRRDRLIKQRWRDTLLYAVLAGDWTGATPCQ
jgi:RimJ/RimL family protein N-acetyltransferase